MAEKENVVSVEELTTRKQTIKEFLEFLLDHEGKTIFNRGYTDFEVSQRAIATIHGIALDLLGLNPTDDVAELKSLSKDERWQRYCQYPGIPSLPVKPN
jgi:hypothetical protein